MFASVVKRESFTMLQAKLWRQTKISKNNKVAQRRPETKAELPYVPNIPRSVVQQHREGVENVSKVS